MFHFKKSKAEFIFLESKEIISVYKSKNKEVAKVVEFNLGDLSASLDALKKSDSDLSKSKNIWLLSARTEKIEKAPLNKEEMFNYAKWKIQEIIDTPIDEIYYDVLTNNGIDNNFYQKHATAVIVNKTHIDYISKAFAISGIPLSAIDCQETALLDFFAREKDLVEKKAVAVLKLLKDQALMCVYYENGIVFDRVIELPILTSYINNLSLVNEEVYRSVFDKLCLEIQRNIDFLERQYGVQHFESIMFSLPANSLLGALNKEISEYFNVTTLNSNINFIYKPTTEHVIPIEVLGLFERGSVLLEHINLIPQEEKKPAFNEDLKKVMLAIVLSGLSIAGIGSVYEWKYRSMQKIGSKIEAEVDDIAKQVQQIKNKKIVNNSSLEKDIEKLVRSKNDIIRMQSQKIVASGQIFYKVMKDIAIQATQSGVTLKHIKYNENGLLLEGNARTKETFTKFLNNLQSADHLKGKSLNLISIKQKESMFEFKISSENMRAR